MGKPLTIQEADEEKIDFLRKKMGGKSKIEVVRQGLRLLEEKLLQEEKVKQWVKSAKIVAQSSSEVNKEFQKNSRLKKVK